MYNIECLDNGIGPQIGIVWPVTTFLVFESGDFHSLTHSVAPMKLIHHYSRKFNYRVIVLKNSTSMNHSNISHDRPEQDKSVESEQEEELSEPLCLINLGKPNSKPRQTTNFDDFNPDAIMRGFEGPMVI